MDGLVPYVHLGDLAKELRRLHDNGYSASQAADALELWKKKLEDTNQ